MYRSALCLIVATALIASTMILNRAGDACPFCSAVSQTLSEEIASMDAVVIATLTELPPRDTAPLRLGQAPPKAKFRVETIVKGADRLPQDKNIETVFVGTAEIGAPFFVMAAGLEKLNWTPPLPLTKRACEYVPQLQKLPPSGPGRLVFFQDYLEDDEDLLARDAYDEFARVPYDEVLGLKDQMNHDQLVAWIEDPNVSPSRRRLYLTMLGVCGGPRDLPMLEKMLRSDDRKVKAGLDAMIACHLTLSGPQGLPLIEELFLKNQEAEYADTYAAIMALRFHGSETEVVPRKRIVEGLRYLLDRPQLADLVIPDLARWEDWSVMTRMMDLYRNADQKSSWVRVPVINYFRACPKPEAAELLKECEKIDPNAMKRANTFFPFSNAAPAENN